ncbi:MAG: hypothetical protein R3C56_02800 [Pirellulaceae bacterium]
MGQIKLGHMPSPGKLVKFTHAAAVMLLLRCLILRCSVLTGDAEVDVVDYQVDLVGRATGGSGKPCQRGSWRDATLDHARQSPEQPLRERQHRESQHRERRLSGAEQLCLSARQSCRTCCLPLAIPVAKPIKPNCMEC